MRLVFCGDELKQREGFLVSGDVIGDDHQDTDTGKMLSTKTHVESIEQVQIYVEKCSVVDEFGATIVASSYNLDGECIDWRLYRTEMYLILDNTCTVVGMSVHHEQRPIKKAE